MAPAYTVDETPDFQIAAPVSFPKASTSLRTLLLAPPSLSAHPELLERIVAAHDRDHTDIQMLDRLAAGLVPLPPETYDIVLLLTDADGGRTQSRQILDRSLMSKIVGALKVGGKLRSQDELLSTTDTPERTEAILAGLVADHAAGGGLMKPDTSGTQSVPLRFGKKADASGGQIINGINGTTAVTGKRKSIEPERPVGVGFVDFGNDLDIPIITGEDDELIDEDELLTEEDLVRPIVQPPECQPKAGKRRRACKTCTCGLKERLEAEDRRKREDADNAFNTLKLNPDELAEVDFTVQGKVGSCGNCALGDAFRCDGCPYLGLPAFKPGAEVLLLNDDVQL